MQRMGSEFSIGREQRAVGRGGGEHSKKEKAKVQRK